MRVVVNGLSCSGSKTGVGHHTAELLRCLRAQADGDALEVFPPAWLHRAHALGGRLRRWLEPSCPPRRDDAAPAGPPSWRRRLMGTLRRCGLAVLERQFRRFCARRHIDLYHEPNFVPFPCDLPTVTTVHDLSVLLHPEWHPADRVAHFEARFRRGLERCAHVLTVSESVRQEILHTFHLPPGRVTVTPNGVRPGFRPLPAVEVRSALRRLGLPPRYLLCVGTLEPRKNVLLLLRAYCSLPQEVRTRYPLLLVGGWGWNTAELAAYLEDEARHRGVIRLGYAAEADLPALYNGARALLFPSFYEGFGLPPLEMLACGGAVLASTAPAVAEVVGTQACLLDPHDADGWRQALLDVVEDDDWWLSLRRGAVEAARRFSWDDCARRTWNVYRLIAGQEKPQRRAG
jgi:alpha-1,3-rhamnosyl/mannosyltransferase